MVQSLSRPDDDERCSRMEQGIRTACAFRSLYSFLSMTCVMQGAVCTIPQKVMTFFAYSDGSVGKRLRRAQGVALTHNHSSLTHFWHLFFHSSSTLTVRLFVPALRCVTFVVCSKIRLPLERRSRRTVNFGFAQLE